MFSSTSKRSVCLIRRRTLKFQLKEGVINANCLSIIFHIRLSCSAEYIINFFEVHMNVHQQSEQEVRLQAFVESNVMYTHLWFAYKEIVQTIGWRYNRTMIKTMTCSYYVDRCNCQINIEDKQVFVLVFKIGS